MQAGASFRSRVRALPRLLEVRDLLLIALSFATGIYEAVCFLSFGKVYAGFQTGNIILLGIVAAGTRPPLGPYPVTVGVSLAGFAAGAAAAMPILNPFSGTEVDDSRITDAWPRRSSAALGVSVAVQVGFVAVWMTRTSIPVAGTVPYLLIGLSAFAMGMQMNAIRLLHVPGISTTAATATFISLVSDITTRSIKPHVTFRLTGCLVGMAAGALVGNVMLNQAHGYAPLPALLINASVLAIALRMPSPKPAAAKLGQRPGRRVLAPLADAHTCGAAPPSHSVEPGQSR